MSRFPFGRPSTRRPPREPSGPADLLVLGVYPSALHVRWTTPDGLHTVGALAVDDEPTVRPSAPELVRCAISEERATLLSQIAASGSPRVVTLGQEASDVFAAIASDERNRPHEGC
jgi:hypothetical protein